MLIHLLNKSVSEVSVENLVVFTSFSGGSEQKIHIGSTDLAKKYAHLIKNKSISGKALECLILRESDYLGYRNLIFVGLGEEKKIDGESLRQGLAAAYEAAKSTKSLETAVFFGNLLNSAKEAPAMVRAAVEGLGLAAYTFDHLKSKKKTDKTEKNELQFHLLTKFAQDSEVKTAFREALILSECVNFSRYLGDMPGNLMTPEILASEAKKAALGTGVKVTAWDKTKIKKEKMGGLLGVSLGSSEEPRFIIMEYRGAKNTEKPIVFVGKGLTFDSGGISIKPSASMEEMKYDMCGGANVIGTILAIAKMKLKLNVMALIPATENMPGPSANKPGDVCVARNGKSFEVNNTDAEGRLILSDALVYASEQKPKAIIDAATLTGAMVVALGNIHTGFFTRDKDLKYKLEKAAQSSGEWVWHMPLTDHHVKDMKGTFADLSNISSSKGAGSGTAAAFLEQFVEEGIPWAHFDIAGTAWAVGSRLNYCPKKGASGVMIRTFVEFAKLYL